MLDHSSPAAVQAALSYNRVRQQSLALVEGLSAEDMVAQSMPDASPLKWHLGHTTWFFETFILKNHRQRLTGKPFTPFSTNFEFLFNSYYDTVGERHPRPQRGLLTRPSIAEVMAYREAIDEDMAELQLCADETVHMLLEVGLHHEMQHQELMLTDLLHLLSCNPLYPAVKEVSTHYSSLSTDLEFREFAGAVMAFGAHENLFSYDNERPRHQSLLPPFRLASRPICNAEWLAFMEDGGYQDSLLWLSDGWFRSQREDWQHPLYWRRHEGQWWEFGLDGLQPLNPAAPVCHISYYEADAYARWSGGRLPREHELEMVAELQPLDGNFLEQHHWRPQPPQSMQGVQQVYGDVWEWSQSAYSAYPGFKPEMGALGEYNGKFMCGQFVLRGGSCATPRAQMRPSYRNFFYPHQRWQYSGLRLARDV